MKNCPFCHNASIQKYGKQNNLQRYKYPSCNKTFTFKQFYLLPNRQLPQKMVNKLKI
ncbi:transposase-like zinc-binding domain-containing protein [Gallibacterium anatis]|uniref:transposase-like zinc-binding domain-containing protein n=1 Tax=Gallibacterium anatis TaxID=750 RepID=UPI0039FBC821